MNNIHDIQDNIYHNVKTFKDLLNTNLMFFKGELSSTYYYLAKWGEGEDQNNHAIVSTNNLIQLTEKYNVFTINGQSSYQNLNEQPIKEALDNIQSIEMGITEYEKNHCCLHNIFASFFDSYFMDLISQRTVALHKLEHEENKVTKQRSFVEFFIEKESFDVIKTKMGKDNRIWYCVMIPELKLLTNMPTHKVCLTDDYTIFTVDKMWREYHKSSYQNVDKILDTLYLCIIVCKDFGSPYLADEILLEYMSN
jgi:hypothetical protein